MSSGRNRRKATLPDPGYTKPASLDGTGLVVTVFGESGGIEGVWDFGTAPGHLGLRRAMAGAFDRRSGPEGTWRSGDTCRSGWFTAKVFLQFCADMAQPPRTAREITPAVWAAWKLAQPANDTGRREVSRLRRLIPLIEGIPPETAAAVDRRIGAWKPPPKQSSYSIAEFERWRAAAAATFNTALVRIRSNREILRRWYAGQVPSGTAEHLLGQALDCVLRTGDVPLLRTWPDSRRISEVHEQSLGGSRPEQTWARLFLTMEEAYALCVLLVCSESWNRSVLKRMRIPEHDPAVAELFDIHMVEIDKRRRPVRLRYTTNNLVDAGTDSPGRLMGQAIEATELAREHLALQGRPTDALLVCRLRNPHRGGEYFRLGPPAQDSMETWVAQMNLRGAGLLRNDGRPMPVTLARLRRTSQVLIRKEPAQNTQETHDTVYVLPDTESLKQAQDTIAQGLQDALDQANDIAAVKVVLGDDIEVLAVFADEPELAKAVIAGRRNTATAACTNFQDGPTGEPGPCTASFLLCLACKNAIVTRQHLPKLVYLHHCLDALRATVSSGVWDKDWRRHFKRLDTLLQRYTRPEQREHLLRTIGDADRLLIDRMLHRGLDA